MSEDTSNTSKARRTGASVKPATSEASRSSWTQDPAGVRRDILAAAREAFVENGFSGARVDDIATRTATSKRMIYYYFGDKRGLYAAVLEEAYAGIRNHELKLDLSVLSPSEALAQLAGQTFDYHAENPDFVRLVMVENIHHAQHIARSERIATLNLTAIDTVRNIYERGVATGAFRADLLPLDIHLTISALAFYNVSNRATIHALFQHDMGSSDALERRRSHVIDAVLRFVVV
ncbi:MAG: TetR/AcrR family transcriptional regulator [Rhabdaerophilum sp.]